MEYPNRIVNGSGGGPVTVSLEGKTTNLTITGNIAANTAINIQTDGTNYTHAGDVITLPANVSLFNAAGNIEIERNGQDLVKGTDVTFVSPTQISFPFDLEADEIISITSLEVDT